MTSIKIGEIDTTDTNARTIVKWTYDDLINAGLPFKKAIKLADPLDNESVSGQLGKLYSHPERYAGATLFNKKKEQDDLLGVVKYNSWSRADQAPYVSLFGRIAQRSIVSLGRMPIEENNMPLGVFALLARPENLMPRMDPDALDGLSPQEYVYKCLLDKVAVEAGHRAVFMSMYPGDSSEPQVVNSGFEPTGKWGKVVGIKQQLYIRPADSVENLAT